MDSITAKNKKITQLKSMASNLTKTVMLNTSNDPGGIRTFQEMKSKLKTYESKMDALNLDIESANKEVLGSYKEVAELKETITEMIEESKN